MFPISPYIGTPQEDDSNIRIVVSSFSNGAALSRVQKSFLQSPLEKEVTYWRLKYFSANVLPCKNGYQMAGVYPYTVTHIRMEVNIWQSQATWNSFLLQSIYILYLPYLFGYKVGGGGGDPYRTIYKNLDLIRWI